MIELTKYGQSTIRLDVVDYYYDETYTFDLDKTPGFNVAFGITYYDNNPDPIDSDPYYGEVYVELVQWGDLVLEDKKTLTLRPCTREELGLENDDH